MGVAPRTDELKLALLTLFTSTSGLGTRNCAAILDEATEAASTADNAVVRATGLTDPVSARFGAARLLNGLCAACGLCARSSTEEAGELMARTPELLSSSLSHREALWGALDG